MAILWIEGKELAWGEGDNGREERERRDGDGRTCEGGEEGMEDGSDPVRARAAHYSSSPSSSSSTPP